MTTLWQWCKTLAIVGMLTGLPLIVIALARGGVIV
jgi:hypothetical protein